MRPDAHKLRLTLEAEVIRLRTTIDDIRQALEDGRRGDALRVCRIALGNNNAGKEVGRPRGGADAA